MYLGETAPHLSAKAEGKTELSDPFDQDPIGI